MTTATTGGTGAGAAGEARRQPGRGQRMARKWTVIHGSEPHSHRWTRRMARRLMHRGVEPEPHETTGKFWTG